MSAQIVLATHNTHKLGELRDILAAQIPGLDAASIISAADVNAEPPVEDGVTFAQNALIKARALAKQTGLIAIADDSGIAVDVLGGAPGIFSALWCGTHGKDQENLQLLLDQLQDIAEPHRGAKFVCAAVMVLPDGTEAVMEGELRGHLAKEPLGAGGFGYDPILIPNGMDKSCAQLTSAEKNAISHRGQAFRALAPHIAKALGA